MEHHLAFNKECLIDMYLYMFYPNGVPTVSGTIELFDKDFLTTRKTIASIKANNIRNIVVRYGVKSKYPKYLGGSKK